MSVLREKSDLNFVRDNHTCALLNIDTQGYQQFLKERNQYVELQKMKNQVATLQSDMSEIKQMLQQLVNGK